MINLVIGGCGHIGRAICEHLLARGDEVIIADLAGASPGALAGRVPVRACDVSMMPEVLDVVKASRPETIYHLGGLLNRVSEASPARSFDVNVKGSLNVFEAARTHDVPRVFFASSRGVYGLHIGDTVDDRTLQRPDTFYGCGKLYVENIGRWYRNNRAVDVRSLRYPTILAPGVRTKGHWASAMIEDAISGMPHHAEFAAREDNGVFIEISDAARAAVELMNAPAEGIHEVNYNIAGMNMMTRADALAAFLQQHYPLFTVTWRETTEPRVTTRWIDDSRARAEWGWKPDYDTLGAILERFVAQSAIWRTVRPAS
ncbi:NAD-dependent epimerase/dehydratase family protein [Martelella sp. HB161492]|uniref:NAD-dependent epimerase/dehydratase family protein n=1 Tax=Martelella sp. HB161492 TaxID=2720726 RepID=UPI0015912DA3|nr:NAD-dependent epimerase/dehydratase family protein [Martelella sp. HB161492]